MSPNGTTGIQVVVAACLGFGGVWFAGTLSHPAAAPALISEGPKCVIKGNISIGSGERIYHLPGHRWYNETVISPEYGERYFCSEAEAQAAGWRAARD